MDTVTANRLRWGALAWVLTLQFFVVETIAEVRLGSSYSRVDHVISDLGAVGSPAEIVMNASFVVQAVLILAGTLLLRPVLGGTAGRVAVFLLEFAAAGVLLVGVFPSDHNSTLHAMGAVFYLLGGGLGLIALAYALRPRSEILGTTLALLGLVGTAMTVFYVAGVTAYLGEGGTERVAAYVLPIALALAGVALWRVGGSPEAASRTADRRAERAQARAAQSERQRERDEALEASARRPGSDVSEDETDDDPWAAHSRRRAD